MARTLLSCLLLFLPLSSTSGLRPLWVVGSSMTPALRPGQLVLLHRDYYENHRLQRGDVVAFRCQGRTYVKRIYALPGGSVVLLERDAYSTPIEGELRVKALRLTRARPRYRLHAVEVPPGHFFSLGDWLSGSIDSRSLGPIPTRAILGRVQTLWGSPLPPEKVA